MTEKNCKDCAHFEACLKWTDFPRQCGMPVCSRYEEQTKWISVEERLPTHKDGKVLIYTTYGVSIAEITVNGRWRGNCAIPKLITHWMPLPMPPKGDDGK